MVSLRDGAADRGGESLALGLLVLAVSCILANAGAGLELTVLFGVDRVSPAVRHTFEAGLALEIAAGLWLGCALVLGMRRSARLAQHAWVLALCLFAAPAPALRDVPAAAPEVLTAVAFITMLAWALDRGIRDMAR